MNAPTSTVLAPPPPKRLEEMKLPIVMMRDILLKTIFRKNVEMVSDLATPRFRITLKFVRMIESLTLLAILLPKRCLFANRIDITP